MFRKKFVSIFIILFVCFQSTAISELHDISIADTINMQAYDMSSTFPDKGLISLFQSMTVEAEELSFAEAEMQNNGVSEPQFFGINPSKREILNVCIDIGRKYNIPPEILYAVAYAESEFTQFTYKGMPYISFDGGIGLMQLTPGCEPIPFDIELAKTDYKYNIEVGAQFLDFKYNQEFLPTIADKNRHILETWYFALWAYNGYAGENNPNMLPMYIENLGEVKYIAYQERLIKLAKQLDIYITPIPKEELPFDGTPRNEEYHLPEPLHFSSFL